MRNKKNIASKRHIIPSKQEEHLFHNSFFVSVSRVYLLYVVVMAICFCFLSSYSFFCFQLSCHCLLYVIEEVTSIFVSLLQLFLVLSFDDRPVCLVAFLCLSSLFHYN